MSDTPPLWDEKFANRLHGAMVLVGVTYEEPSGPRQEQFHGTIISTHRDKGIVLRLNGSRQGELFTFPPHLQVFEPAAPGVTGCDKRVKQ